MPSHASFGETLELLAPLLADSGTLDPVSADGLIRQGVPWRHVAPYVPDREWWCRQQPRHMASRQPGFSLRVWDAAVCIQTRETTTWIDPGPRAPAPSELPMALWPDLIVVTHAHQDHTALLGSYSDAFPDVPVVMTDGTARLLALGETDWSVTECLQQRTRRLDFLTDLVLGELVMRLLPAGHLLGAAMVDVQTPDVSLLVTGDFTLRDVGGIGGAAWPDRGYDLVLMESTATDQALLPVMDTTATRRPILTALCEARSQGSSRIVMPAQAKGQAQEVYATLVLAQQAGEFPDVDVGLAGLAFRIAHEYYQAVGGQPGPWWISPLDLDSSNQPGGTILIQSSAGRRGDEGNTTQTRVRRRQADRRSLLEVTAYTHAGWSERMAFALGVDCRAVAPYHGVSLSVQSALIETGRAVIQLSQQGEEWKAASNL